MNAKRYALAVILTVAIILPLDVLINAVVMRDAFEAAARYWLPADELNRRVPIGFAALSASVALLALLFVRWGRTGLRAGIEFGCYLALAAMAGVAGLYSLVPWPGALLASMAIQQALNNLTLGIVLGAVYRPAGPVTRS